MCNLFSPTCILYPSAIFFLLALSADINVQAIHANISSLPKVSFISLIKHLYHLIFSFWFSFSEKFRWEARNSVGVRIWNIN